ncbi:amphi-Trp domain-containing protein [Halomarina litorea]|uniref:amphi-Trp domain-containing protein n=1 Tax=Halomarina litorea TaxID=2961595 RepID=UPI0020C475C7|nr:amphi-Trp domain-containing protein [Halomarina sp. BCD28]
MSELEIERELTRQEVADYLREFADKLADDRRGEGRVNRDADGSNGGPEGVRAPGRRDEFDDTTGSGTDAANTTSSHAADSAAHGTADDTRGSHESDERTTDRVRPNNGKITLLVGNDSATVNPPERVLFGVEVGRDSSLMGGGKGEVVEFRLHWNADDVPEDDELSIQ